MLVGLKRPHILKLMCVLLRASMIKKFVTSFILSNFYFFSLSNLSQVRVLFCYLRSCSHSCLCLVAFLFMFLFSFLFLFLSNSMSKILFQILLGTIWVTREFRGLVGSWIYLPIERIALLPLEFGLVGLIDWRTVYYPRRSLKKKALYINKKKELQKVFLKKRVGVWSLNANLRQLEAFFFSKIGYPNPLI